VIPTTTHGLFSDPFFPRLLQGIGEELSRNNLQMVLFAPQSVADENRLELHLAGGRVDAVLLLSLQGSDDLHSRLRARGIPTVVGGRPRGQTEVSFVDVDNHAGGLAATEHLISNGRRRIAHIAGPQTTAAARDRFQGFRAAMWEAGLSADLVEYGDLDRDSGELAMERLLASDLDIDAVFAASDLMAAGALWALQTLGRRVPEDVAIIGFDDSPVARATRPQLSSVRQPIEDMGREMTRLVLRISGAEGWTPRQMILGPELAIRESTVGSGTG
jgi:DNA-binding LacI/PurR family transcriptional regulator